MSPARCMFLAPVSKGLYRVDECLSVEVLSGLGFWVEVVCMDQLAGHRASSCVRLNSLVLCLLLVCV